MEREGLVLFKKTFCVTVLLCCAKLASPFKSGLQKETKIVKIF